MGGVLMLDESGLEDASGGPRGAHSALPTKTTLASRDRGNVIALEPGDVIVAGAVRHRLGARTQAADATWRRVRSQKRIGTLRNPIADEQAR